MAGLVVDGQEVVAVGEHDRAVADHHARLVGEHRGVGPGLGAVARDLELDPRGRPGLAVADDVEEPDEAVGRLPDRRRCRPSGTGRCAIGFGGDQVASPFFRRDPKTAVSVAYSPSPP